MARQVQAAAGQRGVSLDDGVVLRGGETAVVSDEQFSRLAGAIGSGLLVDLGVTTSPVTDGPGKAPAAADSAALLAVGTVTASGTLVAARHTPVDATTSVKTMTLPTTASAGVLASAEKIDASANPVNVVGTMRGVASSQIPLTSQYEARTFLSEGSGSWRPLSDHRTAASLTATIAGRSANFDPSDYGAKFDNVTDDFDALQTCINTAAAYARTAGRAVVRMPHGIAYLGKAGGGGLRLPSSSPGLVVEGMGQEITGLRLSKEVLRAFDLFGNSQTFSNLTLRNFFIDNNNMGRDDIGPVQSVSSGVTLANNAVTNVTVPSTAGWATKGRCFFSTGTGTAVGKQMQFTVASATVIAVANYTGGSLTVVAGDTIRGAINDHLIVGTRYYGNDAGVQALDINVTDLLVQNVRVLNVPTILGTSLSTSTGHTRWGACIAPAAAATPTSVLRQERIKFESVRIYGGECGLYVGSFGSTPMPWSAYLDQVNYEDCYHTTGVLPTANYFSLNFEIGGCASGYRASVRRCHGWGSGDVGVEMNSLLDGTVEDCLMEESQGGAYYQTNYGIPTDNYSGPPTMTLAADLTSAATTATISGLPSVGIPQHGYALLDSEVVEYTITASTTLVIARGFNGSTAAAHTSGATLQTIPIHRQAIRYIRCKDRKRALAPPAGLWMPKSFYALTPTSKFPHAAMVLRDCEADNSLAFMGSRFGGGEIVYVQGYIPKVDINGLAIERHGLTYTTGDSRVGALVNIDCPSGLNGPVTLYRLDRIDATVTGQLAAGAGAPGYAAIAFENGNFAIDWGTINVSISIRNAQPQSTKGVLFTPGAGSARLRGSIRRWRHTVPILSGDAAPVVFGFPPSGLVVEGLTVQDLDLSQMNFSTSTGNPNYQPIGGSAYAPNLSIANWLHPTVAATSVYAQRGGRRRTAVTGTYTALATDEYLGCQVTAATTITLPPTKATGTGAFPNPSAGRELLVKDESGNAATFNITIAAASGETIDGATTKVISSNGGTVRLMSIGSGWAVI